MPRRPWSPLWGGSQVPGGGRGKNGFGFLEVGFTHKTRSRLKVWGSRARSLTLNSLKPVKDQTPFLGVFSNTAERGVLSVFHEQWMLAVL